MMFLLQLMAFFHPHFLMVETTLDMIRQPFPVWQTPYPCLALFSCCAFIHYLCFIYSPIISSGKTSLIPEQPRSPACGLAKLPHSVITIIYGSRYHYLGFTDEETRARDTKRLGKSHALISARDFIRPGIRLIDLLII